VLAAGQLRHVFGRDQIGYASGVVRDDGHGWSSWCWRFVLGFGL
jgi:hypothetical protein